MSRPLLVIITGDYEIFGNGTGDFQKCVVHPTKEIMEVCEENNAFFTIMAEMCEYWAFKKYAEDLRKDIGYYPHEYFENQIKDAIKKGHDVQLHFHPQWLNAEYKNKRWILNYEWWRIASMPHGLGDKRDVFSLRGLFFKGKTDLISLLKPIKQEYECIAFRAGGWCIQPAKEVVQAMYENGILIDSTVSKGQYITAIPFFVDFRQAFSNSESWYVDPEDINKRNVSHETTILEVPIFSVEYRGYERVITSLADWLGRRKKLLAKGCVGTPYLTTRKKPSLVRRIFKKKVYSWDFSNSYRWNKKMVKDLLKKNNSAGTFCLVMEGHPKGFGNRDDLSKTLRYLRENYKDELIFTTYGEYLKKVGTYLQNGSLAK